MKKSLLALAVLTAAGSVNAATILDSDGVKVDVTGAAEVQYYKDTAKNTDAYLRMDDGDIKFDTTVEIADGLAAVAGIGFEFEKQRTYWDAEKSVADKESVNGNVENDELYVGLSSNFGTTTFGRQLTVADDSGIGEDYEFGTESVDLAITEAEEVIKHKFEGEGFWLAGSIASSGQGAKGTNASGFDFGAGVTVSAAELAFFYQAVSDKAGVADADIDAWLLQGSYALSDALTLAGSYGISDETLKGADVKETSVFSLAATFTLDAKNTIAGGLNLGDVSAPGTSDVKYTNFYANITHKLHSNVKAYAELGYKDSDKAGEDFDLGYLAGLEVSF